MPEMTTENPRSKTAKPFKHLLPNVAAVVLCSQARDGKTRFAVGNALIFGVLRDIFVCQSVPGIINYHLQRNYI
jgi:hypothetical protein